MRKSEALTNALARSTENVVRLTARVRELEAENAKLKGHLQDMIELQERSLGSKSTEKGARL